MNYLFRDETLPTAQKVQLRVSTMTSLSNSENILDSANRPFSCTSTPWPVAKTNTSVGSWEEEAAEECMKRIARAATDSDACHGPIAFLPLLYSKTDKNSALYCAVVALAVHLYPGDGSARRMVQSKVWSWYGQALEKVNLALGQSSTVQNDEILMTILLFCSIEVSRLKWHMRSLLANS